MARAKVIRTIKREEAEMWKKLINKSPWTIYKDLKEDEIQEHAEAIHEMQEYFENEMKVISDKIDMQKEKLKQLKEQKENFKGEQMEAVKKYNEILEKSEQAKQAALSTKEQISVIWNQGLMKGVKTIQDEKKEREDLSKKLNEEIKKYNKIVDDIYLVNKIIGDEDLHLILDEEYRDNGIEFAREMKKKELDKIYNKAIKVLNKALVGQMADKMTKKFKNDHSGGKNRRKTKRKRRKKSRKRRKTKKRSKRRRSTKKKRRRRR